MMQQILLVATLALSLSATAGAGTVKTTSGPLRGTSEGGVEAFLGIPYATPPIGDNRWRSPKPARAWTAVRSAEKFATSCAQEVFPGGMPPYTAEYNVQDNVGEDCLYLNVWTPTSKSMGKLPVLVEIDSHHLLRRAREDPFFNRAAP